MACDSGCASTSVPPYLRAEGQLSFAAPNQEDAPFDAYLSAPSKPVPFRARPIHPVGYDNGLTWPLWLVADQREASGRPGVPAFVSDVLAAPVEINRPPILNLRASSSGTQTDCVVEQNAQYPP